MQTYRAFRIHQEDGRHRAGLEERSMEAPEAGEILIRARYSGINYKDALAGTGRGRILRRFPLTGGIDVVGEVVSSRDPHHPEGDLVLATGYGLGVDRDGGYAEYVRVPGDWALSLPTGLGPFEAMALGTAGFTAALALHRLEQNGQCPDLGPVVVTGASGGVGSIALDLLAAQGYETAAVSGKPQLVEYFKALGAGQVLGRNGLPGGNRPLERAVWGGAIDNVGGAMLATLTRTLRPWGNIASVGLAGGQELHTSVMPFILRGVSLLGIESSGCPRNLRIHLWQRLGSDLKPVHIHQIVDRTVTLEGLPEVFEAMLAGETRGRTLVQLGEAAVTDTLPPTDAGKGPAG
jgi:acrylyl-CoA reductase (NADPH)